MKMVLDFFGQYLQDRHPVEPGRSTESGFIERRCERALAAPWTGKPAGAERRDAPKSTPCKKTVCKELRHAGREFGARAAFPVPQLVNLTGSRLPSLGR